jgi:hypothetical protein
MTFQHASSAHSEAGDRIGFHQVDGQVKSHQVKSHV